MNTVEKSTAYFKEAGRARWSAEEISTVNWGRYPMRA